MSEEFLRNIKSVGNVDEIAQIVLENWNSVEPDNLSASDIIDFRKNLLLRNMVNLANKLTPLDSFSYNRFNFARVILGEIDQRKLVYNKLKFAIWHKLVTRKVLRFIEKAPSNETKEKIMSLLESLKTIEDISSPHTRREMSEKFMILSDLTGQLGYHMFSILSVKKSVSSDPDFIDATLFLGKAYLEFGSALNRKDSSGKSSKYSLDKSRSIFQSSLSKLDPEKKSMVNNLLKSITSIVQEIEKQKSKGNTTVAQIVVEEFIRDKMDKLEDSIITKYSNSKFKFASNIDALKHYDVIKSSQLNKPVEHETNSFVEERSEEGSLKVSSSMDEFKQKSEKKVGKLYDAYNTPKPIPSSHKPKAGEVKADEVSYKIEPRERLKQLIKEKSEIFKKR
ncbi:MAG: hypothetical protein JXR48_09030 [Candidatus Delongbacteria bacterium]|nr:hypothetical protein [Candidatus Delongbacteria bacterium]MBN2835094.1 hypothetical protein [Candidatus Delongbacteria bacterium]